MCVSIFNFSLLSTTSRRYRCWHWNRNRRNVTNLMPFFSYLFFSGILSTASRRFCRKTARKSGFHFRLAIFFRSPTDSFSISNDQFCGNIELLALLCVAFRSFFRHSLNRICFFYFLETFFTFRRDMGRSLDYITTWGKFAKVKNWKRGIVRIDWRNEGQLLFVFD